MDQVIKIYSLTYLTLLTLTKRLLKIIKSCLEILILLVFTFGPFVMCLFGFLFQD